VEAIGLFINQSPGCRQGTILAPVAAPLPGSGAVSALGHFGTKTRPRGRTRRVTSDASDSDAACRAERPQLRSRKRALRERATPVWRAGDDPGRRPGDWASDNLPRRSGRHGVGHVKRRVTAPGHGGHGAGHGIHGASHSDHGDGERPAGPKSTAAPAAGAAAFTRAGRWDKSRASPR
jgi:hypothetical protein